MPWMGQNTVNGNDKMIYDLRFPISDSSPCTPSLIKRGRGELNRNSKIQERGFTLIELLIVMSIIAILATIAQPSFKQAIVKAREAVLKEDLFVFRDVIDKYYSDKGKYPPLLDDLAKEGYIRGIPKDPFTNSTDTWQVIYSEAEGEEQGIYDVHSGSDLVALDGTPYNEW